MPGKRDVIKDDQGILVAKHHLLMTKRQANKKFKVENTGYPYQFTTFRKTIPRHIKQLSLKHRRVCICTRCYNTENKLKALSKKAIQAGELDLQMTLNGAYVEFICPYVEEFPNRDCIIGSCKHCGPAKLKERYSPLTNKLGVDEVSWLEWKLIENEYTDTKGNLNKKKCWSQETVKDELKNVVEKLCDEMKDIAGHLYRVNFQHAQEQYLIKNLPLDEAVILCDFSQNYALTPQDEIESAHFQQKQVTLHTCLLIRHAVTSTNDNPILVKESIGQFSDNLKHDKDAVFSFTDQLIKHIQNSDGYEINKIHRFSDNAATQYKCKESFSHLQSFQEKYKIKLVYHYCEPGHGKGPADGIGATIKNGLARAVVSDAVVLKNAYDCYLYASRYLTEINKDDPGRSRLMENSRRHIMYLPLRQMNAPKLKNVYPIPKTRALRYAEICSPGMFLTKELSCCCKACIGTEEVACQYKMFQGASQMYSLKTGKAAECILYKTLQNLLINMFFLNRNWITKVPDTCFDVFRSLGQSRQWHYPDFGKQE